MAQPESKLDQLRALRERGYGERPPLLKAHHRAWLSVHPSRSEAWLSERLRDGFLIHHVDLNHENNDPENLVLIEQKDHALMHRLERANDAARKPFDRLAYQRAYMRDYMRKRRAKQDIPP